MVREYLLRSCKQLTGRFALEHYLMTAISGCLRRFLSYSRNREAAVRTLASMHLLLYSPPHCKSIATTYAPKPTTLAPADAPLHWPAWPSWRWCGAYNLWVGGEHCPISDQDTLLIFAVMTIFCPHNLLQLHFNSLGQLHKVIVDQCQAIAHEANTTRTASCSRLTNSTRFTCGLPQGQSIKRDQNASQRGSPELFF